MTYGRDNDRTVPPLEGQAYTPEEPTVEHVRYQEPRKPHKKISWVAALVAGLVVVFVVVVLMLAVLFPNYRRGAKLSKIMDGSINVKVYIETTDETMRKNGNDYLASEDRVKQVLSEMGVSIDEVEVDIYTNEKPPDQTTNNPDETTNEGQ